MDVSELEGASFDEIVVRVATAAFDRLPPAVARAAQCCLTPHWFDDNVLASIALGAGVDDRDSTTRAVGRAPVR